MRKSGTNANDYVVGGNEDDFLWGLEGNDRLNGRIGADRMYGGAGNDLYYVDNRRDLAIEALAAGTDTVISSVTFRLAANVERLTLTGTAAIHGTGNDLANRITGNSAANILSGLAGADYLDGRGGNDTYVVDHVGDRVVEAATGGIDTVKSAIAYTLGANLEKLVLAGAAAIDGTGNGLANRIVGNGAANVLDGGAGGDYLQGKAGDDTYIVDNIRDRAVETASAGIDQVLSSVSHTLGVHVENLTLTGNDAINGVGNNLANIIRGNDGANVLDGKERADELFGGAGADIFAFTTTLNAANFDFLGDFDPRTDTIRLGGAEGQPFAALASGVVPNYIFSNGLYSQDLNDYILYDRTTDMLLYDADADGPGRAIAFARLVDGVVPTAANFVVAGPANHVPVITSGATGSVTENGEAGTVVYQLSANDADGDRVVYSLGGEDSEHFRIDAAGAIRLIESANFEQQNSYSITLSAGDSGSYAEQAITISVVDVVEPLPVIREVEDGTRSIPRDLLEVHANPDLHNDDLRSITIEGAIAGEGDFDRFTIALLEGEQLILDVDGVTGDLDSLLTLIGFGSVDDAPLDPGSAPHPVVDGATLDSLLIFRAPYSGTFRFQIEAFDGLSTGSYKIHVSVGPPISEAELLQEDIDALISGSQWDTSRLTYGFPTSPSQYADDSHDGEPDNNFEAFNAVQQAAVRSILATIANVSNLSFTVAANPGTANLRYAMSDATDVAYAYYPGGPIGGSAWFNNSSGMFDRPVIGNYAWHAILHETGHALGLKHGHEMPAISADRDSLEYSVMTYRSYPGHNEHLGYANESWGFPQSLMMLDIAALQKMYGADFTHNGTDTVYRWSATTGEMTINGAAQGTPGVNRIFLTVWDGGGEDTYDFSGYTTGLFVDLRPGEWTKTSQVQLANLGNDHYARGNIANALLFEGDERSMIENVIGGSGADVITANAVRNRLTGGAGSDTYRWEDVADSRAGEADIIIGDMFQDKIDLSAIGGDQRFRSVGTEAFSGRIYELRFEQVGADLHILGDVDGDKVADLQIILRNTTDPAAVEILF